MGGDTGHRELELALWLEPKALKALSADPAVASAVAARPVTIRTTYYDTGDFAFRRRGFALRVREAEGRIVQTIKTASQGDGLIRDRRELDAALSDATPDISAIPDPHFRALVEAQTEVKPLRRVFRSLIDRRGVVVALPEGGQAELVLDMGVIQANPREVLVHELELELIDGTPASLLAYARALAGRAPVRLGVRSKAARGYDLSLNRSARPVRATSVGLSADQDPVEAFALVARSCLAQLAANEPAVLEALDPEGIHQMRVSLRRLRAGLSAFRPVLDAKRARDLSSEARALAQRLGSVRDLDVLEAELLPPVLEEREGDRSLARLASEVADARRRAWMVLARDLAGTSPVAALSLDLEHWLETGPGRAKGNATPDLSALARQALERRYAATLALGRSLDRLDTEERHELRIAVKKLRYASQFFGGLFDDEAVAAFERALRKLQNSFGALNDVATATSLLPAIAEAAGDGTAPKAGRRKGRQGKMPKAGRRKLMAAADRVIEWHQGAADGAWEKTRRHWHRFHDLSPFWEGKTR